VSPSHYYVLPQRDYVIKAGDSSVVVTHRSPTNYGGGGPDSSEVTITFLRPRTSDRQQDFVFIKHDTLPISWYYEQHIDEPQLKYSDPEKLEQIYLLKDGAELHISNVVVISGKFANLYEEVYQERFNAEESNYLLFGRYAEGRKVNTLEVNDAIVFTWEYNAVTIYGKDTTIAITADPNTKFLFSGQLHILNNTGQPLVLKKRQHFKIMEVNSESGHPCKTGGGSAPTTNTLFQMSPD
jgi:hypothetical protein